MDLHYLLFIALILMSTKVLGLMTKKVNLPQVVGALAAGLILGPGLGLVEETEFIKNLSEIGVIVLMFSAGLETDIGELKKCGKASFIIALIGVLVPLAGGLGVASLFNKDQGALPTSTFLQNIFIGIILTATSVSITVETLKELGKLSTRAGNAIIGAALIDDILGIIALTVVTSLADPTVEIVTVLGKILAFFVCAGLFGVLFHILFVRWTDKTTQKLHRYNVMSFAFCLLFAYAAEEFFGVADITGAFLAGVLISTSTKIKYISSRFETLSYMLLSPVFFASIGLNVKLNKDDFSVSILVFTLLLLVMAVLTKIVGCGLGAKMCKYTTKESLQIGIGMISRGEVALIVANKGATVGLMKPEYFGPIVIMVVITTIITPILLKVAFADKNNDSGNKTDKEKIPVNS
ncbi:MAG: cation:proton antiporter [Oscillospiraceae bacterium]|nr:cation:proton antiporter [Oscillospiraceae bacterium]